jgi:ATP-dependent exoDNAse (exonuclease V) alpha subunit
MATAHYRLETKIVGRQTKGKDGCAIPGRQTSVVAKAAYRSGQSLKDERVDKTFNYRSRTQEVAYSEIMAPEVAPDWLKGNVPESLAGTRKQREMRETLWNTIERVEKRKDSQLSREFIASLPRGLNREQQIELIRGWCQTEFVDKGFVVDLAVHKSKGGRNPHAHVLVTMRPVTADGFGKKPDTAGKFNGRGSAGFGAKGELVNWRESWCKAENAALEKAGRPERADHRSLRDRGLYQIPQPKIGPAATAMQRKGIEKDTQRHQLVRQVQVENEALPFMRRVQRRGTTMALNAKRSRALWLEKSASFLSRFGEKAGRLIQDVREKWSNFLDSRRQNFDKAGPER